MVRKSDSCADGYVVETDGSAQARGSQQLREHSGFGLCSNYDPGDPSIQIPTLGPIEFMVVSLNRGTPM